MTTFRANLSETFGAILVHNAGYYGNFETTLCWEGEADTEAELWEDLYDECLTERLDAGRCETVYCRTNVTTKSDLIRLCYLEDLAEEGAPALLDLKPLLDGPEVFPEPIWVSCIGDSNDESFEWGTGRPDYEAFSRKVLSRFWNRRQLGGAGLYIFTADDQESIGAAAKALGPVELAASCNTLRPMRIKYTVGQNTMPHEDTMYAWMDHIEEKLEEAYPDAEIQVTEGARAVFEVEPRSMRQEVWDLKERLWDDFEY